MLLKGTPHLLLNQIKIASNLSHFSAIKFTSIYNLFSKLIKICRQAFHKIELTDHLL